MVGRPKVPEVRYPDPLPPPPSRSDAEDAALQDEQRTSFARKGRAATFLSGGTRDEASAAVRFLGDAART